MRLDEFTLSPDDYRPQSPTGRRLKIGVVGCGGIVNHAHLPAYRDFGYELVVCSDIDAEAVRSTQQRWDIPRGGTDLDVVLDDPEVEVVDLAVHAAYGRRCCRGSRRPASRSSRRSLSRWTGTPPR